MKKAIVLIVLILILSVSCGVVIASTSGDEKYNDYSNEYSHREQPDPEDIPVMNRAEDRTKFKDS